VGSWGDAGCFSFFPTKNLGGAGDGGAITCRDADLAQSIRELAVHGMPRRYLHTALGYNSRLDAIQAAVLTVKLPHLGRWVDRRRAISAVYRQQLADLGGVHLPEAGPQGHSWNQFVVRVPGTPSGVKACAALCDGSSQAAACVPSADSADFGLPEACCRDWLKHQLQNAGVSTIIYYPIPIHRQPAYADLGYGPGSLPITERLCSEVLSLPIFPELSADQQQQVIAVLKTLVPQAAPIPAERVAA
jgi:dTDP-4-amino-4,6-dideoxygalactose transaminase